MDLLSRGWAYCRMLYSEVFQRDPPVTRKALIITGWQLFYPSLLGLSLVVGTWQWWLVAAVMYTLYAGVGAAVGLHHLLSHNAFTAPRWFRYGSVLLGSLGSLISPLEWVQQHVDHHRHTDEPGDPHSPDLLGWRAWFYCFHANRPVTYAAHRLARHEPLMLQLHLWFWPILAGWLLLWYGIGGLQGILFGWAVPAALTNIALGVQIFSHGHGEAKRRGTLVALLTFGEHNHDQHHARPWDLRPHVFAYTVARLVGKPAYVPG